MSISDQPLATPYTEHWIAREGGRLYARHYPGTGPAFVLMHGFPDNLHIYDGLVPHLTLAGRSVVTFDFLGFGASDKHDGAVYSFRQQLGDLQAVVEGLQLGKIVPVAHDAAGPAAINFALEHPENVHGLCLLNTLYGATPAARLPELIELFAQTTRRLPGRTAEGPRSDGPAQRQRRPRCRRDLPGAGRRVGRRRCAAVSKLKAQPPTTNTPYRPGESFPAPEPLSCRPSLFWKPNCILPACSVKRWPPIRAGSAGWRSPGGSMAHLRPQVITLRLQVET